MAAPAVIVEDILRSKKVIDAALAATDPRADEVVDHLRQLEIVAVTKQVLGKTLIGQSVNKLAKTSKDLTVRQLAKQLVAKWRSVVGDPKSAPNTPSGRQSVASTAGLGDATPASTVGPTSPRGTVDRFAEGVKEETPAKAPDGFVSLEKSEEEKKAEKKSPEKKEEVFEEVDYTTIFAVPPFEKALRAKAVEKIFTALRPRVSEEQPEPMNLAIAVEQELWNQLGSSNQDYAAQLRSVTFNLKDRSNIEFRAKVICGHDGFLPKDLPTLKAEQMASTVKNAERALIRKEAAEMIQTDWDVRNGKAAVSGLFQCGKCKQWKTSYTQAQTRSADEPMTTFVTCLTCGNRWKFC